MFEYGCAGVKGDGSSEYVDLEVASAVATLCVDSCKPGKETVVSIS